MFMGIDNQEERMLGSLLEKFHLPVLTFPPLKMEKWLNDFCSSGPSKNCEYQLPHRMDPVSWKAIFGDRIHNLLLAIELKDYCSNIKDLGIIFMISNSSVILLLKILQLVRVVHQSYFGLSYNYIWLPLKIKYKHLCLHLLESPSSYFLWSKQKEMSFG